MLPKNIQTQVMLSHLFMYKGNYHDLKIPQFMPQSIADPNKYLGMETITPESVVVFQTEKELPAELKHLKVQIDPDITVPAQYYESYLGRGKKYILAGAQLEGWGRRFGRYRSTRPK